MFGPRSPFRFLEMWGSVTVYRKGDIHEASHVVRHFPVNYYPCDRVNSVYNCMRKTPVCERVLCREGVPLGGGARPIPPVVETYIHVESLPDSIDS